MTELLPPAGSPPKLVENCIRKHGHLNISGYLTYYPNGYPGNKLPISQQL